jgi:hypothetical protein
MLILMEILMQGRAQPGHLVPSEQPDHLVVIEANGGGPI